MGITEEALTVKFAGCSKVSQPQIFIKRCNSTEWFKSMKIDKGITIYYGSPEKEKEELIKRVEEGCYVAIAYTDENVIVGFIVVEEFRVPIGRTVLAYSYVYDAAIEVSKNWRGKGIAGKLVDFASKDSFFDDKIVLARGTVENWDISKPEEKEPYRRMLLHLTKKAGFKIVDKNPFGDDFLAVRIGSKVSRTTVENLDKIIKELGEAYFRVKTSILDFFK